MAFDHLALPLSSTNHVVLDGHVVVRGVDELESVHDQPRRARPDVLPLDVHARRHARPAPASSATIARPCGSLPAHGVQGHAEAYLG